MNVEGVDPGSQAALARGCRCAVLDNNHGRFPPFRDENGKGQWWISQGCPLHAAAEQDELAEAIQWRDWQTVEMLMDEFLAELRRLGYVIVHRSMSPCPDCAPGIDCHRCGNTGYILAAERIEP